jgi:hypothetical protein
MSIAYGGVSCEAWTAARKDSATEAGLYAAWVFGFISAYNAYVFTSDPDVTSGADTNTLRAWLDDYCGKHAANNLAVAVQALVLALANRKKAN